MNRKKQIITEEIIVKGKWTISTPLINGKSKFFKFVNKLSAYEQKAVAATLDYIKENGPPHNKERYTYEGDKIHAIKIKKQNFNIRIYCFQMGDKLIILTNGAMKKTQKMDPEEKEAALKIKKLFLESR